MDSLFKKAAEFAEDYTSKQDQQGQGQNLHQNQNQPSQGYQQGGLGGYGGGNDNSYQQQNQGGQGGYGGGGQQQYGGGSGGGGGSAADFFNKTGGEEFNRPHGSGGSGNQGGGGGGGFGLPNLDQSSALAAANAHGGQQHGNDSLFSSAFSMLQNFNKDDKDDIDEDAVMQKHDKAYNQGQAGNMSASSMGAAAALQAFKKFTSGQESQQPQQQQSGGNMQSKIIGMALSEAAKLFDQSGGASSGNKQDAVNSAGATVMKLLLKSQFSGTTGGANSGGLGQLMSMASKFM